MNRDLMISLWDWREGSRISAIIIVVYVGCDRRTVWTVKFDWHLVSSYRVRYDVSWHTDLCRLHFENWKNLKILSFLGHTTPLGRNYIFNYNIYWPEVHGSPFLSFAMIVNVDLCPTLARLSPGPSAHDSIGNTKLVETWPSWAMTLESCWSLDENSTT